MSFLDKNTYILNFGPHHPSTHGVLRLILELSGEEILSCNPDIGYLHRGVEKIIEEKKFLSIIPFLDRLDYLAPVLQEHAFVNAIEKILKINVPRRALIIRTIFDELTRISSHIMGIGSASFELGCLSLFLYGFEEREKIMDIFEATTGARMHLAYYIPGGVLSDIDDEITSRINSFIEGITLFYESVENLTLNSRIFRKRTEGIGYISEELAIKSGISGVNLRASGINYDIRKTIPYGIYNEIEFEPITSRDGDCFARNKLRFLEIKQSIDIIKQSLKLLEPGPINCYGYFSRTEEEGTLYELLHEAYFSIGIEVPKDTVIYSSVESPRGEFGIHLFTKSDQTKPYRMRLKSPSFAHIQLLKDLLVGSRIADATAIMGSLDFVISDCDR